MTADDDPARLASWMRGLIRNLAEHPAGPDEPHIADYQAGCGCRECQLNWVIVNYIFLIMEPTDRVLRPAEPRD